jgi:hypothetical protein
VWGFDAVVAFPLVAGVSTHLVSGSLHMVARRGMDEVLFNMSVHALPTCITVWDNQISLSLAAEESIPVWV